MARQVQVGVIGTSGYSDLMHLEAILEDRPVTPSFYDGWKAQEVIDAALESDRNGCRIALDQKRGEGC